MRYVATVALVTAVLGLADVVAIGTGLGVSPSLATAAAAPPPPHRMTVPVVPPPTTSVPPVQIPASTVLAAPNGTIPSFSGPGGTRDGSIGLFYGYSLVLPVIAQQGDWLQVRLPQRPNQSTTWVQTADVTLSSTPYRLVVNLSERRLTVYQAGNQIMHFPVGIGLPATPTVTGSYFVAVHEPHADPLYGPVILDLSAHSDAIASWEGSGDAIIAIHGPIDTSADALIGTTGARVSNGCIRMHLADVIHLSMIPPGTPVDINA